MNILRLGCFCTLGISFLLPAKELASTLGQVNMSGEIIEAACYVDPKDSDKYVEFGDISARDITTAGDDAHERAFSIQLKGCSLNSTLHPEDNYHNVEITFSGDPVDNNPELIKASGSAKHIGIQLYDRDGNKLIPGKPSQQFPLVNGRNILTIKAEVVRSGNGMINGEFNAVAHFTVGYF